MTMTLNLVPPNHPRHPSLVMLPIRFCIRHHHSQKLTWRGPCGSLSAAINAAVQISTIDQSEIARRSSSLEDQLRAKKLKFIDVLGDDNCFFRARSFCLYDYQDNHTALRKAVSTYITKQSKNVYETDSRDLRLLASNVIKANSWIGEGTILMTANYLRRPINVYIFAGSSSPLVYAPSIVSELSAAAFYEPGHYCSVFDDAGI